MSDRPTYAHWEHAVAENTPSVKACAVTAAEYLPTLHRASVY